MNYNQIQALLEKLPDQQIMQYAQGGNPQVPQVLAQMEAMRRENLRKSETLQKPGINGMAKGGIVRKFNEGGKVSSVRASYANRQAREEALLEEAKRNRTAAMQEPGGPAYAIGNIISSGIAGLRNVGDAITDNPVVNAVGANFRRGQEMRNARDADARANEALAQGPTAFQQKQVPAASAAADARANEALAQGPTEFQTNPQNIPAQVAVSQAPAAGLATLGGQAPGAQPGTQQAAPQQRGPAAIAPAATANPQATPEVLTKIAQATEAQTDKFAQEYQAIFDERARLREGERSAQPDAEKDRKMAFYYALAKFGATLATTGVWAQAGDVGLEAFRGEMEKSKAKQDAFRKESLDIGLAALDDKLAMLGISDKERTRMRAEAQQMFENAMKERQVKAQEQQVQQQGEYQRGVLKNQARATEAKITGGASGGLKGTDINAATARVDTVLAKDPKFQMMLFRNPTGAEQYRQGMINKQVQGLRRGISGLDPFDTGATQETGGIIDFSSLE